MTISLDACVDYSVINLVILLHILCKIISISFTMISFKEVFCSELPSHSNIFHSCSKETVSRVSASSSITSVRSNSANNTHYHYYQFASEKHSLTLKTTTRSKSSVRELLVERLSTNDIKDAAAATTSATASTTCLAHSALILDYLQDKRMSIQVFALMNENHGNDSDESSLGTHNVGAHVSGGVGNNEKEKLQQQTTNSSNNSSMEHHEKKSSIQDNNGMLATTAAAASTTTSSSTASSSYSLMVKIHDNNEKTLSNNRDNSTTKTKITERIYINFRPISVHVAQLHSISSNPDADDHNDDGGGDDDMSSSLMIVGIFVAGDDNKLHFYMTTLQVLKERLQEGEGGGTKSTATAPTCFQPSLIFEQIDPATIILSSGSSEEDYFSKDDPLTFTTPIMAIESCISSEPPSHAASKDMVNRLAVSSYDGMVRIVTYTITCDETSGSFRIGKIKCSLFIVDGPVASLHFGKIGNAGRSGHGNTTQGKLQQKSYQDNLFLLAGSLCGLAFLFYEIPSSSAADASFVGPIVVVDGLYDADNEGGSEDCVTSVHTVRYHGETMLLVGTQGSRLLMFQQVLQNDSASDKKNTLNDEIENKRREISQLSSERDTLRSKINEHCQKLSEIEKKDVEDVEVDGKNVEDDKNEDERNIEEGQTETESTSDTSKKERLIVMKSEVDELEQACLDCTDRISQLETSIDRLTVKMNDTPSPAQSVRKMHRYEFLWEHKLPYPIQSIGSSVCERSGNLECLITTKHTVHVFRVLSMRMVDAAAALLERKFQ